MPPRRIDESSRLTSTLTGLTLAVGIAREATDAVPIVKQCLGAAGRISALAEKIDRDREALHALAERAHQLAQRVRDVMDGRTPDAKIAGSLKRIHSSFERIEAFMTKHVARSRLHRAISYAFTVPQHVERLSVELEDAVQELVVVALLDVNHQVHATQSIVDDNARYVGEFRLLRHGEVHKLDLVMEHKDDEEGSNLVVRYHSARVDGEILVVRSFEANVIRESGAEGAVGQALIDRVTSYDRILEEVSTYQRSHKNVTRIYGWSKGSTRERLTVFKSGFRPVHVLKTDLPSPLTTILHCAFKLLGAANHLRLLGIAWEPQWNFNLPVDDYLEPMIGLHDDLRRTTANADSTAETTLQIQALGYPLRYFTQRQEVPSAQVLAAFAEFDTGPLDSVLDERETWNRGRCMISKADFANKYSLSDEIAKDLSLLASGESAQHSLLEGWFWPQLLLMLDAKRRYRPEVAVSVNYHIRGESEFFLAHCVGEDKQRIVYDTYTIDVPDEQRQVFKMIFGLEPAGVGNQAFSLDVVGGRYRGIA